MNTLQTIRIKDGKFPCIPKMLNQMHIMFPSKEAAMEAKHGGKVCDEAKVVWANFDWQNRKEWFASIMVLWEEKE